jgi:hypothetical protein
MTEVDAILALRDAVNSLSDSLVWISAPLWFLLIFKNMGCNCKRKP